MTLTAALDIGGTKVLAGLVDEQGGVVCMESFTTLLGVGAAQTCCDQAISFFMNQLRKLDCKLDSAGIVCAGPVDIRNGIIENPYTLNGWEGFAISEYFEERLHVPVILENDVNGALIGEIQHHGLQEKSCMMVSVGTGIGVAFYQHGKLQRSSGRFHPEMGHQIIDVKGDKCYCGNVGCFESLCSGNAVNQRAQNLGFVDFDDLFNCYAQGGAVATAFIKQVKSQYFRGFWNLLCIFKPEILILGGGFAHAYYNLLNEVMLELAGSSSDFIGPFNVFQAADGARTALLGASSLKKITLQSISYGSKREKEI